MLLKLDTGIGATAPGVILKPDTAAHAFIKTITIAQNTSQINISDVAFNLVRFRRILFKVRNLNLAYTSASTLLAYIMHNGAVQAGLYNAVNGHINGLSSNAFSTQTATSIPSVNQVVLNSALSYPELDINLSRSGMSVDYVFGASGPSALSYRGVSYINLQTPPTHTASSFSGISLVLATGATFSSGTIDVFGEQA